MKKKLVLTVFLLMLLFGCVKVQKEESNDKLDDLQKTACEKADEAGTCQTKLIDLGMVMPDECCEAIGKCCE